MIDTKGCCDPEKQVGKRVCKHLQYYGSEDKDIKRLSMLDLYKTVMETLDDHGIRLDGSSLCLVQELPGGGRLRLWFDEAARYWEEREAGD